MIMVIMTRSVAQCSAKCIADCMPLPAREKEEEERVSVHPYSDSWVLGGWKGVDHAFCFRNGIPAIQN